MSNEQLTAEALALPLADRVHLAQALWQSIDAGLTDCSETKAVEESVRRAGELDSGTVQGRPHEDAMRDLRRSLRCE